MRIRLALACLVVLTGCGDSTELVDGAEARLVRAAEELRNLMAAGDMAAVIDQMPDDLFPGGQTAKDAATAAAEATIDVVIEIARNMKWESPGTIHQVGNRHAAVVPYSSSVNGLPMRASQIAVSSDGGNTWGFLSGSSGAVAGLRTIAPDLLATIEDEIQAVELDGRSMPRNTPQAAADRPSAEQPAPEQPAREWTAADWDRLFGAPELPAEEGAETFQFNWPDGIRLHVTRTTTRLVRGPDATRGSRSVLEYELVGQRADDGFRVRAENLEETEGPALFQGDALARIDHLSEMFGDWPTDLLIGDPAAPPRLENLEGLRDELRSRAKNVPGAATDAVAYRMVDALLSDPALQRRASEGWNSMVSVWHGNTITFNEPLETDYSGGTLTYSIHPSPAGNLVRLHTRLVRAVGAGNLSRLGLDTSRVARDTIQTEVRTWVDTTPDLVPERFVRVKTISFRTDEGPVGSGTRQEYVFRRM